MDNPITRIEQDLAAEYLKCLREPLSPAMLRRLFLYLMRFHWSDPRNHGDLEEALGCFVHDLEGRDSTFFVGYLSDYKPEDTRSVPGLHVGIKTTSLKASGLGDNAGWSGDNATHYRSRLAETTVVLAHTAYDDTQALLAAESSALFVSALCDALAANTGALAASLSSIGDSQPVKGAPQPHYRVDAAVSIRYTWGVAVNIESHRLKQVVTVVEPGAAT